jgi:STE24 endopeptidase
VSNQLSRRVEERADSFALKLTDKPKPFIAFQRQIAIRNVSDPDPPRWLHELLGTHPTTLERIGMGVAYERMLTLRKGSAEAARPRTPGGS